MSSYPVLNSKYCSPILGCKLPRNSQAYKDQKTKKSVLSSHDTNLCLHALFLIVPICFIPVSAADIQYFLCCIAHNNEASGAF